MADALLARLTYAPKKTKLTPIPWPQGLAPTLANVHNAPNQGLPRADVLVVTWTAAEAMALADVLTPGLSHPEWATYKENFATFLPHLTWRSPAKEAKRLGEYAVIKIGDKSVVCFHSQLHLATDDNTAPVVALWKQIIAEVKPSLIITTGTAGGIGASTVLGDVFIVQNAKFNCQKEFKSQSWAQQRFVQTVTLPVGAHVAYASEHLVPINAERLPKDLTPRMPVILGDTGDVETVDLFAFDDTDDSYGVVKNDPRAHTEEMDDGTLPLALSQMKSGLPWLSVRNASDPMVPSSLGDLAVQKKWAAKIYQRYGYWTTVNSALACWGIIADMDIAL